MINQKILFLLLLFPLTGKAQEIKTFYYPKKNKSVTLDTTIDNTLISYELKTIPDSYVIQEHPVQTPFEDLLYRYFYRDYILQVSFDGESVCTVDKMYFIDFLKVPPQEFILHFIDLKSFNKKEVSATFFLTINKPDTDWTYPFHYHCKSNGEESFELLQFEDDY